MVVQPIEGKVFGARVEGVSLAALSDAEFAEIHAAFLEHGFLVFPEQHLSEAQNIEFGERFGSLEFGALPLANQPAEWTRLPVRNRAISATAAEQTRQPMISDS